MSPSGVALLRATPQLPIEDHVEIAEALLGSHEPPGRRQGGAARREEVDRRVAACDAGEIEAVPREKVRDELWAYIK